MLRSILFCLFSFCFSYALACTHFQINAQDGTVMVARSLEFGPDLQSEIITVPRETTFNNKAPDNQPGVSWQNQYGYVYINGFHLPLAVEGVNEKGLSFGGLYFPNHVQYQTVSTGEDKQALPYYAIGDYILGNFSTVAEVKAALSKLKVFAKALMVNGKPTMFPMHYVVTDATGNSLVIEITNNQMHLYDDPIGVFTNSPNFIWQLTNLRNYVNLTPYAPQAVNVDGIEYAATGQGAGMFGLPGDTSPPSRFVRATFLTKTAKPVPDAASALNLAEHIMNNFDIPFGLVRGVKGQHSPLESTQWVVFEDLKNHVLYFKSYNNQTLQAIHLDKLNLAKGAESKKMPIESQQLSIADVTSQLAS